MASVGLIALCTMKTYKFKIKINKSALSTPTLSPSYHLFSVTKEKKILKKLYFLRNIGLDQGSITEDLLCIRTHRHMLIHFREIISGDLKNVTIGSTFVVFSNKFLASPPTFTSPDSKEPQREVNSNFPLAMTFDKVEP